jgi:ubiquinone biosynthesis protein Coq4
MIAMTRWSVTFLLFYSITTMAQQETVKDLIQLPKDTLGLVYDTRHKHYGRRGDEKDDIIVLKENAVLHLSQPVSFPLPSRE